MYMSNLFYILINISQISKVQGFLNGAVPGTFTRLRSCIVPAEITEPPPPPPN